MPRWRAQARVRRHRGAVDVAKRKSQILRGVPRRKMPGKVRTRRTSVEQILYLSNRERGFDRNGVGLPSLWRGFTMAQGSLRTLPQSGARSDKTSALRFILRDPKMNCPEFASVRHFHCPVPVDTRRRDGPLVRARAAERIRQRWRHVCP